MRAVIFQISYRWNELDVYARAHDRVGERLRSRSGMDTALQYEIKIHAGGDDKTQFAPPYRMGIYSADVSAPVEEISCFR